MTDESNVLFVNGTNFLDKNVTFTIENIFSEKNKDDIGISLDDYSKKAYYFLEVLRKVEKNNFKYDEEIM